MARTIIVLAAGAILGVLATLVISGFFSTDSSSRPVIVRDIQSVPTMSQAAAEEHRVQRYARLETVADVMALPSEFARTEALHVLAGRSDSAAVQELAFDAARIADDFERERYLQVLFFRLTEADPHSAVALASTEPFDELPAIERLVWQAWARKDLEASLIAAGGLPTRAKRQAAAQSLFAAFGFLGNETTAKIEEELGISPDAGTRARYLYSLIDRSPAEAIAFINAHERGKERNDHITSFAYYLARRDPESALGWVSFFSDESEARRFERVIDQALAAADPLAVTERLLGEENSHRNQNALRAAGRELAAKDIEQAKSMFARARSADQRRVLGPSIATELARTNPEEALRWARENEDNRFPQLQSAVLTELAKTDPQLAVETALASPNVNHRQQLVSNVLQQVVQHQPQDVETWLSLIPAGPAMASARSNVVTGWLRRDPDAAMNWILQQDQQPQQELIQRAASWLPRIDIDAAIRTLPMVEPPHDRRMRQEIAGRLALQRSPQEALQFVQRFSGDPDFHNLQASVIASIAQSDPQAAGAMAEQLPAGSARDRAFLNIVMQHAQSNPQAAIGWLSRISDEASRGQAAGQLAAQLYVHDPAAAKQWVTAMPPGSVRDMAVTQLARHWVGAPAELQSLVSSITTTEMRQQAVLGQIYNLLQRDPVRAQEMLRTADISEEQRKQIEMIIKQHYPQ